jgi:hypothetical protein
VTKSFAGLHPYEITTSVSDPLASNEEVQRTMTVHATNQANAVAVALMRLMDSGAPSAESLPRQATLTVRCAPLSADN